VSIAIIARIFTIPEIQNIYMIPKIGFSGSLNKRTKLKEILLDLNCSVLIQISNKMKSSLMASLGGDSLTN
jgi:ADP-heptose:LPS heptosyltransferase